MLKSVPCFLKEQKNRSINFQLTFLNPRNLYMNKTNELTTPDKEELKTAKAILENPGMAAKITDFIGSPIEKGFDLLPKDWRGKIGEITTKTLLKVTEGTLLTMKDTSKKNTSNMLHKLGAATSGGIGGFFGLPALVIELPISTSIMLRSITDIARSQGEKINTIESKLACLEVFALGGDSKNDDSTDTGYFVVRSALAKSVTETAEFIASKGLVEEGSPIILRFVVKIAQRFGVQIGEKSAAQAMPIIGAAGGALINSLFIDHFQDMAKGHFIVRKLERKYDADFIKKSYLEL